MRVPLRGVARGFLAGGAAALLAAAVACGAHTDLVNVWNARVSHPPLKRILVLAVAKTPVTRRSYEDTLVKALDDRGAEAAPSYLFLPSDERLSKELIQKVVRERDIEGVVVTRLLKVDKEQHYVPPETQVVTGPGMGYYGYYGSAYDVIHTPGYWRTVTIVRLETHLYDAESGDLVWGAQSNTFEPSSTEDVIQSVTKVIAKRMAADGLLSPKAK